MQTHVAAPNIRIQALLLLLFILCVMPVCICNYTMFSLIAAAAAAVENRNYEMNKLGNFGYEN